MNTNLTEQLDIWAREQLKRFGYDPNTSDPLIEFFICRIRYPDDMPRVVYKSKELVQQKLPPDVQTALTAFEAVVRRGAPLRPYMSKSIEQSDFFDGLLFDWGFYHFHMGMGPDKKDPKYIQRSEHLLIARIHLDQMYFIKVVPHKNAEWYKDELVRIYADNWPEVAEFGRMEFVDGLTEQIDEKQRKILRDEIHVNSPVDLGDGRVYMGPNLGITGRGTPVIAAMWAQRAQRNAALMQKFMEEKRGFHSETAQISETFWQDHNIQEQKHYNFFKYRNSDFFFARFVILAESITDAQVIEHMLKRELSNKMYYVSIVNLDGVKNIIYPFFLLNDLKIPFCAVVDKDFFTTYKNGKLESSRNATTYLPEYSGDITNNKVNNHLFPTEKEKDQLKYFLGQSYTMFFEYVKQFNLLPMTYCLEMDLISSNETVRQKYYDHYKVEESKREIKSLLFDRKDAIKDPTVLIPIFQELEPKEYPHSYKKIRKELSDRIREL